MVLCERPCKYGGGSNYGIDTHMMLECMKEDPILAPWAAALPLTAVDLTIRKTNAVQGPDGRATIGYADGDEVSV